MSNDLTDILVHSVLYLEHADWILRSHESFEQTLIVVTFQAYGAEYSCWKLLWIANQNQPLARVHKRYKTGKFYCLSALINHNCVEFYLS